MNWQEFFNKYDIEYVTKGPNVKKGNINIKCPFCGDDPSHHLGINPKNNKWGCWRDANHAGRKPEYLVRALLNCSYHQASLITGQHEYSDPDTLDEALAAFTSHDKAPDNKKKGLHLPKNFRTIKKVGSTRRFYKYLINRGFKNNVEKIIKHYNLMACTTGHWKDRIIFPIYNKQKLVTWTSRALQNPIRAPRYMSLSEDKGALINIRETIYNIDQLILDPKDLLIINEGPFDSLKMDYFGYKYDSRATCIFGTNISLSQVEILSELTKIYKRTVLLLDENSYRQELYILNLLGRYGVTSYNLPSDLEDPGELTKKQVKDVIFDIKSK